MKLLAAMACAAAISTASFGARAEACAALDYEEMKDMSTQELTRTYCSYHKEWQDKLSFSITYRDEQYLGFAEACKGQVQRVERILKKREDGKQTIMAKCPEAY